MIRINLLAPERPTEKRSKKSSAPSTPGAFQAYLLLTLFAGGTAFLCAALWWMKVATLKDLDTKIAADEKRQRDLQAIKVQVDAFQRKKMLLEKKVELIEKLRSEQKGPVHLLDEISKALPDFVWLTTFDEAGGRMTFSGQSNSYTAVADFISALQRSGWFPVVDLVSSNEADNIVAFSLSAQFKNLEAEQQKAAQPPPPPGAPGGPAAGQP
jgi:type IV pilus assembly protein PilN